MGFYAHFVVLCVRIVDVRSDDVGQNSQKSLKKAVFFPGFIIDNYGK